MRYADYFQKKKRNDTEFVCLVEGAPEKLKDLIKDIHYGLGTGLPDDWIYEKIHDAFIEIQDDGLDIEGFIPEGDVYNSELIEWLSKGYALELCEEARQEYGNDRMNLIEQIQHGQVQGLMRIYGMVNEFINDNAIDDEEEENG